jgi:molybdate ABC transporter permease protein
VVALPLVLPPSVLGFYLLVAMGPNGPLGQLTRALGWRHAGLHLLGAGAGSLVYSLPFMVQPLQNAFESFGERPLEAAATLRAGPLDAFWHVAVPLARPGYLTGAVMGFAHTLGEFGVVLMIGGNIPGQTRVMSVQIYDHVEALEYTQAHWLAGGMLVFSFVVLLALHWLQGRRRKGTAHACAAAAAGCAGIQACFALHWPGFTLDVDLRFAWARCHRAVRPLGLRQDHAAALHCRAGARAQGPARCKARSGRDDTRVAAHAPAPAGLCVSGGQPVCASVGAGQPALWLGSSAPMPSEPCASAWMQVVELLGIGQLLARKPGQLSGGERQRVAIARALLTSPRLLLMDEPLAALDLKRKQEILPYLQRLHAELDIPVLYVSHAPDEVAQLADHIVVLEAGRAVAAGGLTETLARIDLPIHLGEDAGVVLNAVVAERDAAWHLARVEFPGGSLWVRDGGHALGQAGAGAHFGARCQYRLATIHPHQYPELPERRGR